MSHENGESNSKKPAGRSSQGGKDDPEIDGFVEELRNVLSGLQKEKSSEPLNSMSDSSHDFAPPSAPEPPSYSDSRPSEPWPQKLPASDSFDDPVFGDRTEPDPFSKNSRESMPAPQNSAPDPGASDADFWRGNVLGWPASEPAEAPPKTEMDDWNGTLGTPMMAETPVIPPPSPARGVPNDFDGSRFGLYDAAPPSPREAPKEHFSPPSGFPTSFDSPIPPAARRSKESLGDLLPEMPLSPLDREKGPIEPVEKMSLADYYTKVDALAATEKPFVPNDVPPGIQAALKPPVESAPPAEFPVPIPGTLREKPVGAQADGFDLDKAHVKPEDLCQIACVFPDGNERQGQQFVLKLKETASRAKRVANVQAVFVHPWKAGNVDVGAWAKSAQLSGADTLFVLAARADAALFDALPAAAAREGIKGRVIFLDQLALRTLYADVLIQLQRRH